MKKIIYLIIIVLAVTTGCSEVDYLLFSGMNRVQMNDTTTVNRTFVYYAANVVEDTVYIQVNTIGNLSDQNREVKLVQVPEYNYTYVRDPQTGEVTETIATEKPYKAESGVHYQSFDNAELKKLWVVKANANTAKIPIVLLRDASLKSNSYRLRVELAESDDFGLGETKARGVTILFSDRLERFYSWRVDNYQASAYNSFGKYSTVKHQFMIDVTGEVIDEAWYQLIVAIQANNHYKNLFKEALSNFNNDPANITSGAAPMRETSDPTSPLIAFP
jgi:hypothetical protein